MNASPPKLVISGSTVLPRAGANKTPKLYTGRCYTANRGYRQISFRQEGEKYTLMPVPFLAGNGRPGEVATTQEIGDITVRYDWTPETEWLSFLIYPDGPAGTPVEYRLHEEDFLDVWKNIKAQHPWVEEFLERQISKNTSSIIPVSVVPPSEYEANKKKYADVAMFIKRFGLKIPFAIDEVPLQALKCKPGPPIDFKGYVPTNVRNVDGTEGRVERWYSSSGNGALEIPLQPRLLQLPPDPSEPEIVLAEGQKGIPISGRTKILIRIIVGAACSKGGKFFGGGIDVYNLHWQTGQAVQKPQAVNEQQFEASTEEQVGEEEREEEAGPVNTLV